MKKKHTLLFNRKVLERDMIPRFFRRLAEGVFDVEDLKFRTNELTDFVEKASAAYGFDARNVMAVGYSNGANIIAASILLLRPKTLSGVILFFRAMVPLVPDRLPNLFGKSGYSCHQGCKILLPQKMKLKPSLTCSGKLELM